jgi:hypothetical protein
MHLASAHTRSRRGIVSIIAPRGMVEVNYKITAIRDDRIIESQSADATPIAECAVLPERCTSRGTLIGCFDMKAWGVYVALIKNL